MKVFDLILALQALPPDLIVVAPGYEGGYREVKAPWTVMLKLNVNTEWYYGPHEEAQEEHPTNIPAIVL